MRTRIYNARRTGCGRSKSSGGFRTSCERSIEKMCEDGGSRVGENG